MDSVTTGYLAIICLLVLILSGVHVGIALAIVGALGFLSMVGLDACLGLLKSAPYEAAASYHLSVIPLFLLMGLFAYHSGLSSKIYRSARLWIGKFPGGLVLSTIGAAALFGAACGSTTASTGIFTKIGLPEMLKYKHDKRLSAGAIAASGTLAILIPPSTILVFYGILTEQSIGQLLIAGILPGIVSAGLYLLMIVIKCSINPDLAPKMTEQVSLHEKIKSLKGLWTFPLLIVVVVGGIYTGIFTATESAAFGAFAALLIVLFTKRRESGKVVLDALLETSRTTAMIFLIVIGAMLFSRFLAISRVPTVMAEWIMGLEANRLVVLSAFLLLYVFLGMFLDALGMLAITIPVVFPIVTALGFDPIWYGILMVKVVEVGFITPPLGLNVYVVKGAAGDLVSLGDVFRGIGPFVMMDIITLAVLVAFPQIALFLPSKMFAG